MIFKQNIEVFIVKDLDNKIIKKWDTFYEDNAYIFNVFR